MVTDFYIGFLAPKRFNYIYAGIPLHINVFNPFLLPTENVSRGRRNKTLD